MSSNLPIKKRRAHLPTFGVHRKRNTGRTRYYGSASSSNRDASVVDMNPVIVLDHAYDNQNRTGANSSCIDLTKEEDDIVVVNSASHDTSVVYLGTSQMNNNINSLPSSSRSRSCRRRSPNTNDELRTSWNIDLLDLLPTISLSPLDELIVNAAIQDDGISFPNPLDLSSSNENLEKEKQDPNQTKYPSQSTIDNYFPSTSTSLDHSASHSRIFCAICLENDSQIRAGKKQLMSTTCGHIFCNLCINQSMKTKPMCPSCRKKLTKTKIHPIYI